MGEYNRLSRRSLKEMGMNYYMRINLLTKAGYSEEDFAKSKKLQSKVKTKRAITKTVSQFQFYLVEEAVESAYRKMRRMSGKKDHWKCNDEKENITKLTRQDSIRQERMLSTS